MAGSLPQAQPMRNCRHSMAQLERIDCLVGAPYCIDARLCRKEQPLALLDRGVNELPSRPTDDEMVISYRIKVCSGVDAVPMQSAGRSTFVGTQLYGRSAFLYEPS